MPGFLRERKLGIDDQIRSDFKWKIQTNEGEKECTITKYDPEKMKHTVQFDEGNAVSIMPDILEKRTWTLDLLDMATDEEHPDTLKLKQFNKPVDQNWINEAHRDMASRWWRVMSFDFRISIMRLARNSISVALLRDYIVLDLY
eukprot:925418_1